MLETDIIDMQDMPNSEHHLAKISQFVHVKLWKVPGSITCCRFCILKRMCMSFLLMISLNVVRFVPAYPKEILKAESIKTSFWINTYHFFMIKHIIQLCKLYYREGVIFLLEFSVGEREEADALPDLREYTDSRYVWC